VVAYITLPLASVALVASHVAPLPVGIAIVVKALLSLDLSLLSSFLSTLSLESSLLSSMVILVTGSWSSTEAPAATVGLVPFVKMLHRFCRVCLHPPMDIPCVSASVGQRVVHLICVTTVIIQISHHYAFHRFINPLLLYLFPNFHIANSSKCALINSQAQHDRVGLGHSLLVNAIT